MNKLLLIGAGGHFKSVLDVMLENNDFDIVGVLDPSYSKGTLINGIEVLGDDSEMKLLRSEGVTHAFVSLGSIHNNKVRKRIFESLINLGYSIPSIISKNAHVSRLSNIKDGVFVGHNAVINADAKIGEGAIINSNAVIEHEAVIGSFTHVATSAVICGQVVIGEETHIGANATIIQNIEVGHRCLIGAGSLVNRSIGNNILAYGNPCRIVKENV